MFHPPWRILPLLFRPWRAVRGLDEYPDWQCARLVRRRAKAFGIAVLVYGSVSTYGSLAVAGLIVLTLARYAPPDFMRLYISVITLGLFVLAWLLSTWLLSGVYAYAVGRILLAALELRCPRCRYHLVALEAPADQVRCPECGHLATLAQLDATPEDLRAGRRLPRPASPLVHALAAEAERTDAASAVAPRD